MNANELIKAVKLVAKEKNISEDVIFEGLTLALTTAYKKNFNSKTNVIVKIDRESGDIKVYSYLVVVPEIDYGTETEDEEGEDFGSVYTHEWNDDEQKREIAESIGVDPGDVTLYLFDGWTKTAKYKEV